MKQVLELIENKKREFGQLPFFQFMKDKTQHPKQRLAWAPCLAPLAMSFADVWKYYFRDETTEDQIQKLINRHTYEDDDHWVWYLEDIQKLGLNKSLTLNDGLKFAWSEQTKKTRLVSYEVVINVFKADPVIKLAAIEAVEATFHEVLAVTIPTTIELQNITHKDYSYFGGHHSDVEEGHTIRTGDMRYYLENIEMTDEQKNKAFDVVEKIFLAFTESLNELLVYAQTEITRQQSMKVSPTLDEELLAVYGNLNLAKQESKKHKANKKFNEIVSMNSK